MQNPRSRSPDDVHLLQELHHLFLFDLGILGRELDLLHGDHLPFPNPPRKDSVTSRTKPVNVSECSPAHHFPDLDGVVVNLNDGFGVLGEKVVL